MLYDQRGKKEKTEIKRKRAKENKQITGKINQIKEKIKNLNFELKAKKPVLNKKI